MEEEEGGGLAEEGKTSDSDSFSSDPRLCRQSPPTQVFIKPLIFLFTFSSFYQAIDIFLHFLLSGAKLERGIFRVQHSEAADCSFTVVTQVEIEEK